MARVLEKHIRHSKELLLRKRVTEHVSIAHVDFDFSGDDD